MAYKIQWQNGRWSPGQIPETPKILMHALTREKDAPGSLFRGVGLPERPETSALQSDRKETSPTLFVQ